MFVFHNIMKKERAKSRDGSYVTKLKTSL